jgi:hypothetical protein
VKKLPFHVISYTVNDPRAARGGVETFASRLRLIFDKVTYMTPDSRDVGPVVRERLPVICDNHLVLDWPDGFPVVGFQHGVAAVKHAVTGTLGRWRLAKRQQRAAKRDKVVWVACASWVGATFGRLYGNHASHIIPYTIDTAQFDARLDNEGSRLVLHDARETHKGSALVPRLARAFPEWTFEPLDCPLERVADRMRKARMFIHLSAYEGNSVVCNEAMAMNLPCFMTEVGLMRDEDRPNDVWLIDAETAYCDPAALNREFRAFVSSLGERRYRPRDWILEHSTPEIARAGWKRVVAALESLSASSVASDASDITSGQAQ